MDVWNSFWVCILRFFPRWRWKYKNLISSSIHPSNHPTIISHFFHMKHLSPLLPDLLPPRFEVTMNFTRIFLAALWEKNSAPPGVSDPRIYPPFASVRSGSLGIGGLSSFHWLQLLLSYPWDSQAHDFNWLGSRYQRGFHGVIGDRQQNVGYCGPVWWKSASLPHLTLDSAYMAARWNLFFQKSWRTKARLIDSSFYADGPTNKSHWPLLKTLLITSTLPETKSLHPKMDGWKTFSFPFGIRPLFRCEMLVSGRVYGPLCMEQNGYPPCVRFSGLPTGRWHL